MSNLIYDSDSDKDIIEHLLKSGLQMKYTDGFLHFFGIRNSHKVNTFDDYIGVSYLKQKGEDFKIFVRYYPATTTPGTHYLKHPMNPKGTAILPTGHHTMIWKQGLHRGYPALVQNKPLELYRDNNKDNRLDFSNPVKHRRVVGINLHRASRYWLTRKVEKLTKLNVDKWSAGCQVVASKKHFDYLMWFVSQSSNQLYSYTLIDNYDTSKLNLNDYGEDR